MRYASMETAMSRENAMLVLVHTMYMHKDLSMYNTTYTSCIKMGNQIWPKDLSLSHHQPPPTTDMFIV